MGHGAWGMGLVVDSFSSPFTALPLGVAQYAGAYPNSQFPMPNSQFPMGNSQCPIPYS